MSFIHYKLITNQNYEKIAFDGVSLSVSELKKLVLEKKFRKLSGPSSTPASTGSSNGSFNKRLIDVDLEVTNVDTNEVYKNDSDLIPKNSRVHINRVVRNIGPALAGGTITQTHKESELLADLKIKNEKLKEKMINQKQNMDIETTLMNEIIINGVSEHMKNECLDASLYDDIIPDENNSNFLTNLNEDYLSNFNSDSFLTKRLDLKIEQVTEKQKEEQQLPPEELLCPFEDADKSERHLMNNAIIVPCCGYFICCEECIRDKLNKNSYIECPHETCLQEITINHRLTPYKPIRTKVNEYISSQSLLNIEKLETKFSSKLFKKVNSSVSITNLNNQQNKDPSPNQILSNKNSNSNLDSLVKTLTNNSNNFKQVIIKSIKLNSSAKLQNNFNEDINSKIETNLNINSNTESRSRSRTRSKSPISVVSSRSSSASSISTESSSDKVSQVSSRSSSKSDVTRSNSKSPVTVSTPSLKDENLNGSIDKEKIENVPEKSLDENNLINMNQEMTNNQILNNTNNIATNMYFNHPQLNVPQSYYIDGNGNEIASNGMFPSMFNAQNFYPNPQRNYIRPNGSQFINQLGQFNSNVLRFPPPGMVPQQHGANFYPAIYDPQYQNQFQPYLNQIRQNLNFQNHFQSFIPPLNYQNQNFNSNRWSNQGASYNIPQIRTPNQFILDQNYKDQNFKHKHQKHSRSKTKSRSRSRSRDKYRRKRRSRSRSRSNNKRRNHSRSASRSRTRSRSNRRKDKRTYNNKRRSYSKDRTSRDYRDKSSNGYQSSKNKNDSYKEKNDSQLKFQNRSSNLNSQKRERSRSKSRDIDRDRFDKEERNRSYDDQVKNKNGNKTSCEVNKIQENEDESLKKERVAHKLSNRLYKKMNSKTNDNNNNNNSFKPDFTLIPEIESQNVKYKNSSQDLTEINFDNKKRIVVLLKGGNNNIDKNNEKAHKKEDESNEKNVKQTNVSLGTDLKKIQQDYFSCSGSDQITETNTNLSSIKITVIQKESSKSETVSDVSSPKKVKRRVHLKKDLATSNLSSSSTTQIAKAKPVLNVNPKEEINTNNTYPNTCKNNNNNHDLNDEEFLDISINEKEDPLIH